MTWILCYTPEPHLDMMTLDALWASASPGDFVPHLGLIAVDSFFSSPGPGDSGPYLGIIVTWFLNSLLGLTWTW